MREDSFLLGMIFLVALGALLVVFIELWYLLIIPGIIAAYLVAVRKREKTDRFFMAFAVAGMLLVFFVALPVVNMLRYTTPDTVGQTLGNRAAISSIILSMSAALYAVLLSLLLGIPLAYVLARRDFAGKGLIEAVIDIPVVVPHTVAGIALLMVLGRGTILGSTINFVDAMPGIVAAMMFVSAPFIVNSLREGFEAVDPRMEFVARSLGASGFGAFRTVTLPLSVRSIFMGAVMGWARAISEFGAVVIIAYYPMIAPTYIYAAFNSGGLAASRPVASLLLLICIGVFVALRLVSGRWKRYARD